uniref:CASP-like protein n=1 Tax=Kalanchoe fedtschenkoi TaxID=63787 RepID=A0A7N0T6K5_KALFE
MATLENNETTPVTQPVTELPVTSAARGSTGLGRWRKEDIVKSGCLVLRGLALLFSLISLIIMATNKHGDGRDFDEYEEYRYVLAIAILSALYTGAQCVRHVHEFSTRTAALSRRTLASVGFCGDQILAYLLISSASSAIPMTNRTREWSDNLFTDSLVSAISMSCLAFFALALSAIISGYKLATRSYV